MAELSLTLISHSNANLGYYATIQWSVTNWLWQNNNRFFFKIRVLQP